MNPNGRNCFNYGNFETRMIVHGNSNCCNYDHSENNVVDSWSSQLLQLWQFWKKKEKKKNSMILNDRNSCNYGNFEKKIEA